MANICQVINPTLPDRTLTDPQLECPLTLHVSDRNTASD